MATFGRAELRNHVLMDLGIYDPTEAPEAEDAQDVDVRAQSILEYLSGEGLIPFDLDSDDFPSPYLVPLAAIIAATLVNTYGVLERKTAIEADAAKGMKCLRRMKAQPYFGTVAAADYF